MKKKLLTIIALLAFLHTDAQSYYYFKDSTGTNPGNINTGDETSTAPVGWTQILTSSNAIPTLTPSQTIPFTFNFDGGVVTSYSAISNGTVTFASNPIAPAAYGSVTLPSSTYPDSSINIIGIEGSGTNDGIWSNTFGTAPNRQHWIYFVSYTPTGGTNWTYWSIVLEETTNKIYIVDQRSATVVSNITAGIQINSTTAIASTGNSTLDDDNTAFSNNRYHEFIYGNQPMHDMAAKSKTVDDFLVLSNGPHSISGTIQNRGTATVTSYDLNYKIGTGTTVTSAITGVSIANGAVTNFTHPMTWNPTSVGTYSIEAWATNINGNPDANTIDDKISFTVKVVDTIIPRKTLMEVFTSSTCGPCVAGNQNMDNVVVPSLTPGTFTIIKYQQNFPGVGDPYSTTTSVSRRGFYLVNSIPRMEIDGQWDINAASLTKEIVESFQSQPSFIGIDILRARIAGPVVAVDVDITPYDNLTGNLVYHVVVTEKETDQNVATNGETEFSHVMMDMLPTLNGTSLTSLSNGVATNVRYLGGMSLDNIEEVTDLRVVVFVQDMTTKVILQSDWMDITVSPTAIDENITNVSLNVYPNPSNGLVNLQYVSFETGNVNVTVMNTLGAIVHNTIISHDKTTNKSFDFSHLTKGVYLVNVSSDKGTVTKKMIIQ